MKGQVAFDKDTGEVVHSEDNTGPVQVWLEKFRKAEHTLFEGGIPLNPDAVEVVLGSEATPGEMARMFKDLRELYETADRIKKQFGKTFDWLRVSYIPARMDDMESSSIKIPDYGRLGLTDDLRVKVIDQTALFAWLEENDLGDMISETVNASTLKASLRKRLKKGEEVPDMVELTPFTRANLTKS